MCFSFLAIYIAVLGGKMSNLSEFGFIKAFDGGYYKGIVNYSLPLVDTVYNSGNASVSITGEIKDLIGSIFSFNIDDPISILNADLLMLHHYYTESYEPDKNRLMASDDAQHEVEYTDTPQKTEPPAPVEPPEPEQPGEPENNGFLPDVSSSITYEGDEVDRKDLPEPEQISGGKITIQNETKYKVNIEELLNQPLKFSFDKKNSKVLIFHTHTTESYIRNMAQLNQPEVLTRSSDPRYSVVRVGEELAQNLKKKYGIQVIHNGTVHDYPDYNKSYVNSLATVKKILSGNPSAKIVIDLHRDAVGGGKKLRRVVKVNNKNAASIMFVMATGEVGLSHPQWRENLKLALKLQAKLNEIAPGLARPIYLSKYRYNQHLSTGALLVEIGGDGNLLEECFESTKYLAQAINEVVGKK